MFAVEKLFTVSAHIQVCHIDPPISYKAGNLEFKREQLIGMKTGISLRMKVS